MAMWKRPLYRSVLKSSKAFLPFFSSGFPVKVFYSTTLKKYFYCGLAFHELYYIL